MSVKNILRIPTNGYIVDCTMEVSHPVGGNVGHAAALASYIATAVTTAATTGSSQAGTGTIGLSADRRGMHQHSQFSPSQDVPAGLLADQHALQHIEFRTFAPKSAYQEQQRQANADMFAPIPACQQKECPACPGDGLRNGSIPERLNIGLQGFGQTRWFNEQDGETLDVFDAISGAGSTNGLLRSTEMGGPFTV
ncbi:hypothetical protein LTR85_010436 [Meristemomyces frigidus]|nr:hypothetical protein LTR85_010436 [Meristemomyces frigidus]